MKDQEDKKRKEYLLDEEYKMWYRHREDLEKSRLKVADDFDKYLLTFATGSLVLSINFTNNIKDCLTNECLLVTGWIFLIASVLLTLISFNLSEAAHAEEIERVDQQINKLNEGKDNVVFGESFLSKIIGTLNWLSLVGFVVGIVFLVLFYFLNIVK